MTAALDGNLVEIGQFFAPATTDMVDGLIGQYEMVRAKIEEVATLMSGERKPILKYFLDGNSDGRNHWYNIDKLFDAAGAIADLNAEYWQRALELTDVLSCMPQKRRGEWHEQIRNKTAPDFKEDIVRDTLMGLLQMRTQFFSERVAGTFSALSGEHVTNSPSGFQKRMIVGYVIHGYGITNSAQCGHIHDLRCVIARFMGREGPQMGSTDRVIRVARRNAGTWMTIDGGSMRIRVYEGVGTAHIEVHPEMAWRLNCILASLYPMAIPAKHRQKPKKPSKEYKLMERPLPFAVIEQLAGMEQHRNLVSNGARDNWVTVPNSRAFKRGYGAGCKAVMDEAEKVVAAIGGVQVNGYWQFDYDPQAVLDEIICSGCIPDEKSHQYYPTPENLAEMAVSLAGIEPGNSCLEPSAGQGGLADFMPMESTLCVEVNQIHCSILEAKGFKTVHHDFLAWSSNQRFDRCVMNPPFSEGRWQEHTRHAATMVSPGGRLVAILPASAKGKDLLPGFICTWHGPFENMFAGTSVSVTILEAVKSC